MFGKDKWVLNESSLWFQEIETDDEEEATILKGMLEDAGYSTCEMIAKTENQTMEEALGALNSLIDKGVIWWTSIDGERWYRIKPMPKKDMKAMDKFFKKDKNKKGKVRK